MKRSFLFFILALVLAAIGCDNDNDPAPDRGGELAATACTLDFLENMGTVCNYELSIGTARWDGGGKVTAPGQVVRLSLYAGVSEDGGTSFPAGSYTLDPQNSCQAGTFSAVESYAALYERGAEQPVPVSRNAFKSGRAVFAEGEGGVLSVALDLVLDDGRPLHVTWSGVPEIGQRLTADVAATFCEFRYWRDYYASGNDNFTVYIGTADHEGLVVLGPGEFLMLSIQAPAVADYNEAKIVPGTYRFDRTDSYGDMTIAGSECVRILYLPDADGDGRMEETHEYFRDGTLVVAETAPGTYDIELLLDSNAGGRVRYAYSGQVPMFNNYANLCPDTIEQDREFVCGFGEASFFANGAYCLDLMSGQDPYQFGGWFNRDRMRIYLELDEADPERIAPGVYTVGGEVIPGGFEITENTCDISGSHYFYLDEATFEAVYGFFRTGTVEISCEEDIYSIRVDAVDTNGHSIRASYEGTLTIHWD